MPTGESQWVLAFDVTGPLGSATVARVTGPCPGGGPLRVRVEHTETFSPSNRHAAHLLPAIRRALERAGVGLGELHRLAATRGPGSFTGLRVGLASLHGLALASGLPAVGVSSLGAAALADRESGAPGRCLAVVDALRGELFAAVYDGGPLPRRVAGPRRLRPGEVGSWAGRHGAARICGPGMTRYREPIARSAPGVGLAPMAGPLAPAAVRLAAARPLESFSPKERNLEPLYLRAPDIHAP